MHRCKAYWRSASPPVVPDVPKPLSVTQSCTDVVTDKPVAFTTMLYIYFLPDTNVVGVGEPVFHAYVAVAVTAGVPVPIAPSLVFSFNLISIIASLPLLFAVVLV